MYQYLIKPFFDFLLALLVLLGTLPLFLTIIMLLAFTQKGKVFFIQSRPGYLGKPFKVLKFCTLNDSLHLTDSQRATSIGKVLRKFHLDELPQLINILKGEMSWVGPRPLLNDYLPIYTALQHQRHSVKPGLTGMAQIKGGKHLALDKKTAWDIWYIRRQSFGLDFLILLYSVWYVLRYRSE